MGAHETTSIIKRSCEDFCTGVTLYNLIDIDIQGPHHTWHSSKGGQIVMSRLGRAFSNEAFLEYWSQLASFKDLVHKVWSHPAFGSPMSILVKKLKDLKCALKFWNWQHLSIEGLFDDLLPQESDALSSLDNFLLQEEAYLWEQSRVKWLKEGDQNSSFFHNMVKRRKAKKTLSHMKIGENVVEDLHLISNHIQSCYSDLFAESHNHVRDFSMVQEVILNLVSSSENAELCRVPNEEKIRLTAFEMDALSQSQIVFLGSFFGLVRIL
ncbi:hypothetical protein PanWU01x14_316290 [Parasponia andersonii]|uniref:Uncharacterized protein n=1 Tax=Parasponia andersonii TaxID=3476 RepID=A0A2P5AN31_PARAD|nr:hypothetical protein PanWU01x14_316290 [Parasponia andersonii]